MQGWGTGGGARVNFHPQEWGWGLGSIGYVWGPFSTVVMVGIHARHSRVVTAKLDHRAI